MVTSLCGVCMQLVVMALVPMFVPVSQPLGPNPR
jgi:hypothetical protein